MSLLVALVVITAACSGPIAVREDEPVQDIPENLLQVVTTAGPPSGNRYFAGSGSISEGPIVVELDQNANWVVGARIDAGTLWVVALEDGTLTGYVEQDGSVESVDLNLTSLPQGTPPALLVSASGYLVLAPPSPTGSILTNPLALEEGGLAFLTTDDALILSSLAGNRRIDIVPLPDGRLTVNDDDHLAVLTEPTDRYDHGVVGDRFEAAALTVVDLVQQEVAWSVEFDELVIEGVAPLWADLDGDGSQEPVVTLSDDQAGARLAVLGPDGVRAESEPIGLGGRWRHQIAVAPFGPNGEIELVDIRTPHITGIAEFFRMDGDELVEVASLSGVTTHGIRSRNLDQGLAADFNADGLVELVASNSERDTLVGVQRTAGGAEVVYEIPLPAAISSNFSGVTDGEHFSLAVGVYDKTLLIWP